VIGKSIAAPLLLLTGVVGVAVPTLVIRSSQQAAPVASTQQSQGTGTVDASSKGVKPTPNDNRTFAIAGSVTQLVPGTSRPLTLTISNPNGYDIDVMSITTTVSSPGADCPASSLVVPPYTYTSGPTVTAPGKGSTTMTLTAQFVDSLTDNQSGCNDKAFPLTFTGTAEKSSKK
jgi:hypothetical protein